MCDIFKSGGRLYGQWNAQIVGCAQFDKCEHPGKISTPQSSLVPLQVHSHQPEAPGILTAVIRDRLGLFSGLIYIRCVPFFFFFLLLTFFCSDTPYMYVG